MSEEYWECWYCGKPVMKDYFKTGRAFCPKCFEEYQEKHAELVKKYATLKIKVMFETALRTMEKSGMYINEYQDAAMYVFEEALSDTEKFYSSHEIITAIILEESGYKYKPNYPIGKYIVDFYVPELKVCIEVDGHLHKWRKVHDSKRDIEIRGKLGKEWEIVRIPTKYIEQSPPRIIDAIIALREEKQKIRSQNCGIIPEWFSKREGEHYKSIVGTKKVKETNAGYM